MITDFQNKVETLWAIICFTKSSYNCCPVHLFQKHSHSGCSTLSCLASSRQSRC